MRVWVVAVLVAVSGMIGGCSTDIGYLRDGVGVDLGWSGQAEATRLQELYVGYICQQAGLTVSPESCAILNDRDWAIFVQAGLNDIDMRCDAYLAWLDERRRSSGPILQQISDVRTATTAILGATGVGVQPIAIVSAAFGLAASSFANFQSRLVLEVNHSTVQTIVLNGQRRLRLEILRTRIDNRPTAMHALRQYLRICMPFTIETEINTTITAFERGGADAVDRRTPLVDAITIQSPVIRDVRQTLKPGVKLKANASPVAVGPFERSLQPTQIKVLQRIVCVPQDGVLTQATRDAILAFLRGANTAGKNFKDTSSPDRITNLDATLLRQAPSGNVACNP
jgi:hypothetical protein